MEIKKEVFAKIWKMDTRTFGHLLLDKAKISPYNVRPEVKIQDTTELATSIKEEGLIQLPLSTPEGAIFVGGRRLKAHEYNKQKVIPVEIRDYTPAQQWRASLAENTKRKTLTIVEEGKALYNIVKTEGISERELARQGLDSQTGINKKIQIYKQFEKIRVSRGDSPIEVIYGTGKPSDTKEVTFEKAKALLPLKEKDRKTLVKKIQNEGLTKEKLGIQIKKAEKIRKLVSTVQDEKKKEVLEKTIEPMIYDEEMTAEVAEKMVLQTEGLLVKTPEVIIALYDILPKIQNFCKMFPKFSKYEEKETEKDSKVEIEITIPKELMKSVSKEEKPNS